jgi:hypothetical protein
MTTPEPLKQQDSERVDGGAPDQESATASLRRRVLEAAEEIRRLRKENASLRSALSDRPTVDPASELGLPEDAEERRRYLDEMIKTLDFYIKRDS